MIVGPTVGSHDHGVRAFIDPVAYEPCELLELILAGAFLVREIPGADHYPLPVLFDVDHHVAIPLRGLAGLMRNRRCPVLDGRHWGNEADRLDGDFYFAFGMLLENSVKHPFDIFPPLEGVAVFIHDLGRWRNIEASVLASFAL